VLETARALGYRPNLAARFLSSRKVRRIGVALPREIASYWDLVRDGIETAARAGEASGVTLVSRPYPRLGEGEIEALESCLQERLDGLVISPGQPARLEPWIAKAHAQGIPVVCVDTDAPGTARLTTVCVDPVASGSLAGDLMGRFLGGRGRVLLATGLGTTTGHAERVESFRRTVAQHWPDLEVAGVVETRDDQHEASLRCRQALAAGPRIDGVYVATANSLPVLRALEDEGLSGKVTVITTDLFPDLCPHLEAGRVAATLYQRPWTQGRIAFQSLLAFLTGGAPPPPLVSLPPQIVMRSNLRLFLDHMRPGSAGAVTTTTPG
jgi:LacI family transcriptional regulator